MNCQMFSAGFNCVPCYFRRFLLAWDQHGHRGRLDAHVVNYADDFVICCPPGNGVAA
jgi:hypothetical protein